jgi:hypothetical protein
MGRDIDKIAATIKHLGEYTILMVGIIWLVANL